MMQKHITKQGLLELHKIVQMRFPHNVIKGKIDEGKIEAITSKPQMILYGQTKYDTIYKKAACYLESIIRMHPFPDGNKRTAILTTFSFLHLNGFYLVLPLDTIKFLVGVACEDGRTENEIDTVINRIAVWLEQRTATDMESLKEKLMEYVCLPIADLAKLEESQAMRILDDWFVLDHHSEHKRTITHIVQFMETLPGYGAV